MSTAPDGTVPAGPLSAAVAEVCLRLRTQVSPEAADGLTRVVRRLHEPLQVAVAGRLKSGKSTLVNALIGRRVAPTGVGECTRLVTRFRYGTVDRIEVVFRDGTTTALPFAPDGMIPADLGPDLDRVSHLEAYLTSAALRHMTVVDTPGLGSPDPATASRTEDLLHLTRPTGADPEPGGDLGGAGGDGTGPGRTARTDGPEEPDATSRAAVTGAEAVLYVVTQTVRADDEQALAAFTAATASRAPGPVNAVAVLNKADTVAPESVAGSDGDVWTAASVLARRQAETLRPRVADVLPVIGLVAETTETGRFTAADAEALRRLAALDGDALEVMLVSADLFTSWECAVPAGVRVRLLEKLDLYGIRRGVDLVRAAPEITAGALRRLLQESSGLARVRERLDSVFAARADGIKAAVALGSVTALARAADDPGRRRRIDDAIEALLAGPEAHRLRMLEALTLLSSGAVELPRDLTEEVLRVGSAADVPGRLGMPGASRAELAGYALERANWWRSFASLGATPAQGRIAHVVHRAYFLLWQRLGGSGDGR